MPGTKLIYLLPVVLSLLLLSCGESEPPPSLTELRADAPVLTIKVLGDGTIIADNTPTTLDTLNTYLPELAKSHGLIWFYRDQPNDPPQPAATDVLRLALAYELPICLARQPSFIDLVKDDAAHITPTE